MIQMESLSPTFWRIAIGWEQWQSKRFSNFLLRTLLILLAGLQPNKADLKAIAKEAKRDVKRHLGK
jgi:hypothetical protein